VEAGALGALPAASALAWHFLGVNIAGVEIS
jgi:hypothetical protein